ncbi:MAG: carbon-nitrogen hydrolase family protein [Deltaproteobacteria bacterium]|nr:carbon-nitrogen hydrolase family protein [Deltaproteobacteria bacterium]
MTSTADVERNLATVERLVGEAVERGARLAAVPEGFAYLGPEAGKRAIAEALPPLAGGGLGSPAAAGPDAPVLARMSRLAREAGIELLLGGFWERAEDPDSPPYNACLVIDAGGRLRARYRKVHLFDVELPDGSTIRESQSTSAGLPEAVVVDCACGPVGLSVCYDLRFPELYRALVDRGAEVLAIPSAFTALTGAAHWHVLLRARAIESQCWVLAPAQSGEHFRSVRSDGREQVRESYGHALIVDPWGVVVAEVQGMGEGVAVADVDPERTRSVRAKLPSLRHRRPWPSP